MGKLNYKDLVKNGKIIKGLNDDEINEIKDLVWHNYFKKHNMDINSVRLGHNDFEKWENDLLNEISTIEMINSCFCYGDDFNKWKSDYVLELGTQRVDELYEIQINRLRKTLVSSNVYTDFEGISYNVINW